MASLSNIRHGHITMTDPTDRINPEWTVGDFEEEFEGREFLAFKEDRDHFLCDFCSKGVPYARDVELAGYVADGILNTDHPKWQAVARAGHRPIVPLATYCDDCRTRMLYFPCEGYAEIRYLFRVSEDRVIHDVTVTDVSPRDDGIPWDAREVTEAITGTPFDKTAILGQLMRDEMYGPENVITFLLSVTEWEVDLRDLVRWDGSLDPKELGQARRKFSEYIETIRREGYDRKKFRDRASRDEE